MALTPLMAFKIQAESQKLDVEALNQVTEKLEESLKKEIPVEQ